MARLRFGVVSESVREGRAWLDFARQVEDSGIDAGMHRCPRNSVAMAGIFAPGCNGD
jgi:hypothetical protein